MGVKALVSMHGGEALASLSFSKCECIWPENLDLANVSSSKPAHLSRAERTTEMQVVVLLLVNYENRSMANTLSEKHSSTANTIAERAQLGSYNTRVVSFGPQERLELERKPSGKFETNPSLR